jgi:MoaA/NifB/PqqE/SkfB family radical SAM enzyme
MISFEQTRQRLNEGANLRDIIWENLLNTKISIGQLDPNGLCNAGCWFCPVKYEGNPPELVNQLDPFVLDDILANIRGSKVCENFNFMYTAHYNEVLLYKHFDKMLDSFATHKFGTMVLSNGTTITPAKTDLIINSPHVYDVALNIPALKKVDWARLAGFNESVHTVLLRNLDYLHEHTTTKPITVLVNCITEFFAGDLMPKGVLTTRKAAEGIVADFKDRYPKFKVIYIDALVDRAGWLESAGVLKNQRAFAPDGARVISCDHDATRGSRLFGWLHINSKGQVFLCCDDYKMVTIIGDLTKEHLDKIWLSERHIDAIMKAFTEMCLKCAHHVLL